LKASELPSPSWPSTRAGSFDAPWAGHRLPGPVWARSWAGVPHTVNTKSSGGALGRRRPGPRRWPRRRKHARAFQPGSLHELDARIQLSRAFLWSRPRQDDARGEASRTANTLPGGMKYRAILDRSDLMRALADSLRARLPGAQWPWIVDDVVLATHFSNGFRAYMPFLRRQRGQRGSAARGRLADPGLRTLRPWMGSPVRPDTQTGVLPARDLQRGPSPASALVQPTAPVGKNRDRSLLREISLRPAHAGCDPPLLGRGVALSQLEGRSMRVRAFLRRCKLYKAEPGVEEGHVVVLVELTDSSRVERLPGAGHRLRRSVPARRVSP